MATEGLEGGPQEGGSGPSINITPITDFLTEEEFLLIPEGVRVKIYEWSNDVGNNVNHVVSEKSANLSKLENSLAELDARNKSIQKDSGETSRLLEETTQKYRSAITKLAEIEEAIIGHQKNASELQIKMNFSAREKDEMVMVVNKRNEEIERLTETIRNLSDQLQKSTEAKLEAIVKVDELTSKEMELQYKEKQMDREKEWVAKQVQLLTEELDKKNAENMSVQHQFTIKHLQLQADLSEKNEQIRLAELSLDNIKKANESQEKHIEHLINKLRDAEDIESKMEENYRQELAAQRKIANLYKESSEEASKKVEELEDAVSNLQDLLKNATTKYGELETKFIHTCKNYQDEISAREEKISIIKKELENANKLIENFQSKGLTDEMIHSLSPAAAAATSMLKNSKSLTQIYSEYHDLSNEVIIKNQECVKLNEMVRELLQEIQTKGPELEKEKTRNQKFVERIEILQSQLDLAVRECEKAKGQTALATKNLGGMERENSRLRAQVTDLAMQVRSLLKETETQRGNYSYSAVATRPPVTSGEAEVPEIESPAQLVVSKNLITFRNIEELQIQNQKLVAVVRELTESQEKTTREAHENQLQAIRDSFQDAVRELDILREKRMSQDKLLESVSQQRDALADLLKQQKSPSKAADPGAASRLAEIQRQYDSLQAAHKSLQEEFDTYRKERGEHEKLAVEQTEKLRDDVMKMRTENAKLASQVDYNNERTKIYNANLETYKKNIQVLEERNKKYGAMSLKLEQSLELMKSELNGAQQKLARTEVALNSMTQERNGLRDSNSRLQAERDILKKDTSTQQMLHLNLQEIKNGLQLSNSALKLKLENEVETLRKENSVLRRKISTETERFKEAVFSWESANKELIQKLRNDQDSLQTTKEELENSKATVARLSGEIEDLQAQVKVLSNTTLETVNAPADQPVTIPALERQIKDLQSQLRDAKIENETLNQHLTLSRKSTEEYRVLCASIEGQISTVSDESRKIIQELQESLNAKEATAKDLEVRLSTAETETATLKDEKAALMRELESKTASLDEEINRMRRDLQAANMKLQTASEESVRVKMDLEKQNMICKDIQEKYEKELEAHRADVATSNDLKNELEGMKARLSEEERARRNIENQMSQSVENWTTKENGLRNELTRFQESKVELETLNSSLQDQIINLTTRMEVAKKKSESGESGETSAAEGGESSDAQKSSEQWLQLVRYLRRENEIQKTRAEMAEANSARRDGYAKHIEKTNEDLKRQLNEAQDSSHVSIITSAKQADLLRKVETLSALTDSNRMLREEKESAEKELEELRQKYAVIEVEIGPLREKASELEVRCEGLLNDNTTLKVDVSRWRQRATTLLEKSNKVNPEEMKKLQVENDNMTKQVQAVTETSKKYQMEISRLAQQVKLLQQQTIALQGNIQLLQTEKKTALDEQKKINDEKEKFRADVQSLRLEVSSLKNAQVEKDDSVDRMNRELDNVNKQLEEQKTTVKTVKGIARKYKKQYEDLQTEVKESGGVPKQEQDATLEGEGSAAAAAALGDAQREEISRYEQQVKQLQEEIEAAKREAETIKNERAVSEERLKNMLKQLREKLQAANNQKAELDQAVNENKQKINSLEVAAEETSSRFAALKSQYEGRVGRLEKENKDLKTAAAGNGSELNLGLQQENEELKKELEMTKQRCAAVENRCKLQSQTAKMGSPEKVLPVEKAKANIRPIPGPSPKQLTVARPPLTASIRPISVTRKATVSVSAMPTQNQQASSSNVQSGVSAAVVAPVSQAQVSTSTPDQSSATPESSPQLHQLAVNATSGVPLSSAVRQAAAVQPTVTVAPVGVGSAGGVGSGNSGAGSSSNQVSQQGSGSLGGSGISSGSQMQQSQQSSSSTTTSTSGPSSAGGNNDSGQVGHQDPSTSSAAQMMESEMGDSSEQVSSSEGSTHQNVLTVTPLRNKQNDPQQSSSSSSAIPHQTQAGPSSNKKPGNSSTEEPSPSSSTLRPTQSTNKRLRDDPHHSRHDEEEDILSEPDTKRTRVMGGSIDREAEALGQQESSNDQMIEEEEEDEEDEEREADQGSSIADDAQVQRSDTTTNQSVGRPLRRDDHDDSDSDVIVIESDDEDAGVAAKATTSSGSSRSKAIPVQDEVEDLEEEDVVEDEEQDDEEDFMEDEDDVDDDDDDDHGDDDDGRGGKKMGGVKYEEEEEGQEGREAESLEHDEDDDIREVHDVHEEDSQDILDSNDSNLNPVDFTSQDQSQQHELREAEQSIDDEGDDDRELVPEPTVAVPIPAAAGSSIRPPRDLNLARGSPIRMTQASRGGIPPMLGRQQQSLTPSFSSAQYSEEADDSIVPGTPTLYVPRRSDGFAEAVSSPQIQPGGRFTFSGMAADGSSGSHGGTGASSSGNVALDDTRMDFLSYDDGGSGNTGRSVPSTPLQVSPPVEVIELSAEMQADEDAAQEEGISVAAVVDVHPTSSSIASVSGSDAPAITVTSAMESSSNMFQSPIEASSKSTLDVTRLTAMGSQPRTSTHTEVSSVTSSDEDKVPVAGPSAAMIQHPWSSTSSRAASPTPSSNISNPPTEQKEPVPQPQQQQQQQQGGRTRPTPIVWDQPSSSSNSNPTSRPTRGGLMGSRGGAMPIRHMIQPDQGHMMSQMARGYRPMMIMRGPSQNVLRGGPSQSARRSRPHSRGGPVGPGTGGAGGAGGIGGRMPFQKPF